MHRNRNGMMLISCVVVSVFPSPRWLSRLPSSREEQCSHRILHFFLPMQDIPALSSERREERESVCVCVCMYVCVCRWVRRGHLSEWWRCGAAESNSARESGEHLPPCHRACHIARSECKERDVLNVTNISYFLVLYYRIFLQRENSEAAS